MNPILIALLPVLGGLVGAYVQYLFTTKRETINQKRQLKVKAYSDYLLAAAEKSSDDEDVKNAGRVRLTDAKARIVVYGSKKVIEAIADFDRNGARLNSPEDQERFIKITKAMRSDDHKDNVAMKDTAQLLFGTDLN